MALDTRMTVWVFATDYRDNRGELTLEVWPIAAEQPQPPPPQPPPPQATQPPQQRGYCVLRRPDWYQPVPDPPPVCFEFYLAAADARPTTPIWANPTRSAT